MLSGDEGVVFYSSYCIQQIVKGNKVKENLALISNYMLSIEYHHSIYDFYRLYWTWDDDEMQFYWDGATRVNIEQIAINTAKNWLNEDEGSLNAI